MRPSPTPLRSKHGWHSAPTARLTMPSVPEVANAKASLSLAEAEFDRIAKLLDQRVVSQSEYDQRRTQVEAARQQYSRRKNAARQQYQALQAARARVAIARKAAADTVVRAPFTGIVGQRLISTGDYVTKGMKIAESSRSRRFGCSSRCRNSSWHPSASDSPSRSPSTHSRSARSMARCDLSHQRFVRTSGR